MSDPVTNVGDGHSVFLHSAQSSIVTVKSRTQPGKSGCSVRVCDMVELFPAVGLTSFVLIKSAWGSFKTIHSFANKIHTFLNSTSIAIVVTADLTEETTVKHVEFTQPPKSAAEIFREGGDSYVSTVEKGAKYIGAYSFIAHDEATFLKLKASASAEFSAGSLSASFDSKLTNIKTETGLSWRFDQTGPGIVKLPTQEDMVTFVMNFSRNDVHPEPPVMAFSTRSYMKVAGCPPEFARIDNQRLAYFDPSNPVAGLVHKELMAQSIKPRLQAAYDIYNCYGFLSVDPQLSKALDGLSAMITAIETWRHAVDSDPTNRNLHPPIFDDDALLQPSPRYSLVRGAWAGGHGGEYFEDVTYDMVASGVMPTRMVARGGTLLDGLRTTYEFRNENKPSFTTYHGGDGGVDAPPVEVFQEQQVTRIEVNVGDTTQTLIGRIQISVDGNSQGWYPTKDKGEKHVGWTLPNKDRSFFVGWAGHSCIYMDGLQPLFVEFNKCHWMKSWFAGDLN